MKKEIDFDKLSSQLKRVRAQYPVRITRAQFAVALKGVLNSAEADRLFDYYLHRDVISAISKTTFIFKQHQEYFSTQSLVELFSKNQIQTRKYCHWRDASPEQKEAMAEKRAQAWKLHKLTKEGLVEVSKEDALKQLKTPAKSVECTIKALSAFSDEELVAELQRRENILNSKKRLNDILAVAEMSLNDLKALIDECEEKHL